MTAEQIESIIKFGMVVVAGGGVITVPIYKWIAADKEKFLKNVDLEKEKVIQNAYGPKRVAELENIVGKLNNAIDNLTIQVKHQSDKYDELIDKITDKFLGR